MPKQQENTMSDRNIMELPRPFRLDQLENVTSANYREARSLGFSTAEVDHAWQYGRKLAGAGVTV